MRLASILAIIMKCQQAYSDNQQLRRAQCAPGEILPLTELTSIYVTNLGPDDLSRHVGRDSPRA